MDKIAADLLKNRCQSHGCQVILGQYDIFCVHHLARIPLREKIVLENAYSRLCLNERKDRTKAWALTVKRIGAYDAAERLGEYRDALEAAKKGLKKVILGEICRKIHADKWEGERFKGALA